MTNPGGTMDQARIDQLREHVRGEVIDPRTTATTGAQGLQRDDRPPSGGRRATRRTQGRDGRRPLTQMRTTAGRRPGRRAQRARIRHRRRRRRDRPVAHARGARRPATQTARAEGGATWGDFNAATHAFGLATTGGIISTTGVGGLTLGGGIGYLSRGFGLSCDNLISADVVTATAGSHRQRGGERRPLLGAARRRRQLRRRHVSRVPAAPGEGHLRRSDVLRARGRARRS